VEGVQTVVIALDLVGVLLVAAVVGQTLSPVGHFLIVGDHDAGVTVGAQIFAGVETVTGHIAQDALPLTVVSGAVGLGGVGNNLQVVLSRQFPDRVHVGRLAVKMHRDDGFCFWGYGSFDLGRVDVQGGIVHVHEHRRGTGMCDRLGGGDERVGRRDHLVAGADAQSVDAHVQGGGAAAGAHAVLGADIGGKILLVGGYPGPTDKPGRLDDFGDRLVDFVFNGCVLSFEIYKGNSHGSSAFQ